MTNQGKELNSMVKLKILKQMKTNLLIILLALFQFGYSQVDQQNLISKFKTSIEINNSQNLIDSEIEKVNFYISKDSAIMIFTYGTFESLDLSNLKASSFKISVFFRLNQDFLNIYGFENTDISELINLLNQTNQKIAFSYALSSALNTDVLLIMDWIEQCSKYSKKELKLIQKLDKKYNVIPQYPFRNELVW